MSSGQRKKEKESKRQELMFPILKKRTTSKPIVFTLNSNKQEVYIRKGSTFVWKKDYCTNVRVIDVPAKGTVSHSYKYWNMAGRIPAIPWKIQGCSVVSCYKRTFLLQVERLLRNLDTLSPLTLMILLQNLANSFANKRPTMGGFFLLF